MFDFSRRINRLTYFWGTVISLTITVGLTLLLAAYDTSVNTELSNILSTALLLILFCVYLFYNIAILKQRCNDVSGSRSLLLTILFAVSGLAIALYFIYGEKEKNQYGPVPPRGVKLY